MTSESKVILFYISLLLQSCSSVLSNRSNIHPITRRDLLDQNILQRETAGKIDRLQENGFIGGSDPNNNDIRKQLMFVFFHSLRFKQMHNLTPQQKIDRFRALPDFPNLIWESQLVQWGQREIIEFKLKHLLTEDDTYRAPNIVDVEDGNAPTLLCNNRFLLVSRPDRRTLWPAELVEIDHLLKDNSITIEIPGTVHRQKTKFLDGLINAPDIRIIRDSSEHWERRYRDYRGNRFPLLTRR